MGLGASTEEGIYNLRDVFAEDREELLDLADDLLIHAEIILEDCLGLSYDYDLAQAASKIAKIREEL